MKKHIDLQAMFDDACNYCATLIAKTNKCDQFNEFLTTFSTCVHNYSCEFQKDDVSGAHRGLGGASELHTVNCLFMHADSKIPLRISCTQKTDFFILWLDFAEKALIDSNLLQKEDSCIIVRIVADLVNQFFQFAYLATEDSLQGPDYDSDFYNGDWLIVKKNLVAAIGSFPAPDVVLNDACCFRRVVAGGKRISIRKIWHMIAASDSKMSE